MARPRTKVTPEQEQQIDILSRANCTTSEISAYTGVSEDILERRYAGILAKRRFAGAAALRAKQYDLALKGNVTMLIWLGKQYLGQSDKHDIDGIKFEPLIVALPAKNEIHVVSTEKNGEPPQITK